MPNEVRIEAIEHKGHSCWQVRIGHRGLRFPHEDLARAFAAQLFARRQWLKEQGNPSTERP